MLVYKSYHTCSSLATWGSSTHNARNDRESSIDELSIDESSVDEWSSAKGTLALGKGCKFSFKTMNRLSWMKRGRDLLLHCIPNPHQGTREAMRCTLFTKLWAQASRLWANSPGHHSITDSTANSWLAHKAELARQFLYYLCHPCSHRHV